MNPILGFPIVDDSTRASAAPGRKRDVQIPAVVGNSQAHERGAGTDERVFTMLQPLADCMQALETSKMQVDEKERLRGAINTSFYASDLGRGMGGALTHGMDLATTRLDQHADELVAQLRRSLFEPFGPQRGGR
ncbi:unnamed protein product [Hyaloperonospora brassicae]|uniref:Uncharacterized protein n=1 Tax=Hyaloperonospora brassicae TaxID=162125 RepID=A0AAV0TL41_HYABA|nr:unnamed protein product [Hyaloperonospora brassicae]